MAEGATTQKEKGERRGIEVPRLLRLLLRRKAGTAWAVYRLQKEKPICRIAAQFPNRLPRAKSRAFGAASPRHFPGRLLKSIWGVNWSRQVSTSSQPKTFFNLKGDCVNPGCARVGEWLASEASLSFQRHELRFDGPSLHD